MTLLVVLLRNWAEFCHNSSHHTMPRQCWRHGIRRTVNALGVGISLIVVAGGSSSWAQAAGQGRRLAFIGFNTHQHSRGYANGRRPLLEGGGTLSPSAAPPTTTKPTRRRSVTTARGAIRDGSEHQSWRQARTFFGVLPRRENLPHVSGRQHSRSLRSVEPLQASTSVLLHDEPVRLRFRCRLE